MKNVRMYARLFAIFPPSIKAKRTGSKTAGQTL
jgi:hypothetical protein